MRLVLIAVFLIPISRTSIAVDDSVSFVRSIVEHSADDRAQAYLKRANELDWQLKTSSPPDKRGVALLSSIINQSDFLGLKYLESLVSDMGIKEQCWRSVANVRKGNAEALALLRYWAEIHPNEVGLMRFGPFPEEHLGEVLKNENVSPEKRAHAAYELKEIGSESAVIVLARLKNDSTEVAEHGARELIKLGEIVTRCIKEIEEARYHKK